MLNFMSIKEFLRKCIHLHCQLPEVYEIKSEAYKNRDLKNLVYEKPIQIIKWVEINVDIEIV